MIVTSVIQVLDDNERAFIVSHIPAAEIRSHFIKNPNPFQSIVKGFQAKTLSDEKAKEIVLKNFNKPFVQGFIEPYIKKWMKQIEDDYTRHIFNHDAFVARLLAVSSSIFVHNTDLYFKLKNDDTSKEEIRRFKEEMYKLKEKEQTEVLQAEKKELQQQIDENARTILSLSKEIQELQSELSDEKQMHQQTKRELKSATDDRDALNIKLAEATNRIVSSATQTSQMQDELIRLRQLTKFADNESSNGYSGSYPYTSICSVWHDDNDKPWLSRIADIKNGVISLFFKDNTLPRFFENRDRLFWYNGPSEDGTIGVWNWNATPRDTDSSTDYVVTSYNQYAGLIEVVELPGYSSFDEIAQYLVSGSISGFSGRRILFALPTVKGNLNGLLCSENDFEMHNGKATLKSSVFVLPQYTISTSEIIAFLGKRFFNRVTLGVPKNLYQIRKPMEVVIHLFFRLVKGTENEAIRALCDIMISGRCHIDFSALISSNIRRG